MLNLLKQNKAAVALFLAVALVAIPVFCFASDSTPTLNLDFTAALATIFDYASMIFVALIPVAAIGIGFRFGGNLLSWVGDMLGNSLHMRR